MILTALLLVYQFFDATSKYIGGENNNRNFYYYQQTYNLIENIMEWHNFNVEFWVVVSGETLSDHAIKCAFLNNDMPKILFHQQVVNFPASRNFAAIFFVDTNHTESQLNMSRKLPPDVIKIYLDHSGCQLNETKLAEIMNTLWLSDEIGFIYYISFCSLNTTSNYDSIDNTRRPHKDHYNCTINLFYHQPFVRNKSGQWGVVEKMDLINDREGDRRQRINMSSQVFHYFPFQRKHSLKLNRLNMTVILFPSTSAYHKNGMKVFNNQLTKKVQDDPLHNIDAYFGGDAEVLKELQHQMNFTLNLFPTSDRQLYGFKVSAIL